MQKILFTLFTLFTINSFADCPGMTVTPIMFNPSCAGNCDGYGYVSVSGGSGNYNYFFLDNSMNTITTVVNDSVYNLCAGNYYAVIHDITNGCFDTTLFVMVEPQPLVVTAMATNVSCFGFSDGTATAIASGGTPPYAYSWNIGATTQTITNLSAGAYFVQVVDANGCFGIFTVVVNEPPAITAFTTGSPATCGLCDGTISSNIVGGTPPYTIVWDDPLASTTQLVSNLCPGIYTGTITDANGCLASTVYSVASATLITVNATSNPSACTACTGFVLISESGGTAPYTYDLTNMTTQSTGTFTNVCPGAFVATVTDNNGCVGTATVNVITNTISGLSVTDSIQNETGAGMGDGFIDLSLTGTTGPYTFLWSNGATTEDIYSLSAGVYSVVVTDNNGDCMTFFYTITTTPSYGFITGYVYNDGNGNCIYDSGDAPLTNYYVVATDGVTIFYGVTNAQGYYSIWAPTGTYQVTPYSSTNLSTGCTTLYTVGVTNGSTNGGNDFAYNFPQIYDVCVNAWSPGIVPGFNGNYYFYVNNTGNMTANGDACFILPAGLTYINATPSPASVNGDTICFSYSGLAPGSSIIYYITFNAPSSLQLGTPMIACMNATITNGVDVNPGCNSYCYTRIVSSSFDPNDKSVSPSGDITVDEDELTYLIRFQNTGTGPAVNVVIYDTLSALLNPSSIEVLNASHNYVLEIVNGNILKWKFENIMLPDSGSNEPASHGFIQFRIQTTNTPVVGQIINNTADIYFDFNEPVITNTTENEYISPVSVEEWMNNSLIVYPNPAREILFIQNKNGNAAYRITDLSGKILLLQKSNGMNTQIDIQSLANGIYFLESLNNGEKTTIKFIKH